MNDKHFGGKNVDKRYPVFFVPQPGIIKLNNGENFLEEWRSIHDYYPEINDFYYISSAGRVFHKYLATIVPLNVNMNGYYQKHFSFINGSKTLTIHRLVMRCFRYIEGCENLEVNHIDGNKLNNCINNLEWCTRSQNIIHAMRTGLNSSPTLTEEQVHYICKLLENRNLKLAEISDMAKVPLSTIGEISENRAYKYISCNYNIYPRKASSNFSNEEIHKICQYFENNEKSDDKTEKDYAIEVLKSINYPDINSNKIKTVADIHNRRRHNDIAKNYLF